MKLAEKHRPKNISDIKGQDKAVQELQQALQQGKPVLLYGPPGTGKTSIAHAMAEDMNYEVIEVNASDTRNKEAVQQIIGQASQQQSLFSKGKIILIDEVDGIAGNEDRGGLTELNNILDMKSPHPIILTANDPWDSKFNTLRKKCVNIELGSLNYLSIAHLLKHISEQENITIEEETIKKIAQMAGGDARAAINDLESLSLHNKTITKEHVTTLDQREQTGNIFNALRQVFKGTTAEQTRGAYDNVDIDVDDIMLWLDENLPLEYQGKDLQQAYEKMSKADIFKRRIQRWQHWRFLAYIYELLSIGIATAKTEKSPGYVGYKRTSRILKLWIAKQKNAKKKEIAELLKPALHASTKRISQDVIPYLKIIAKKDKNFNPGLEEEQLEWLQK